jgi:hypothetical protein
MAFEVAEIADQHKGPVERQSRNVGIDVVDHRHSVDDQVELALHRYHLRGVGGDHDPVGAKAARVGDCRRNPACCGDSEKRHNGTCGRDSRNSKYFRQEPKRYSEDKRANPSISH